MTEQSPGARGAQQHDGEEGPQRQLNWSRRRLSAGVGVQGRGTRSWQWELRGACAGLMRLFFFFLLCKAGRCHRMSAHPWQAVRACILCSGS